MRTTIRMLGVAAVSMLVAGLSLVATASAAPAALILSQGSGHTALAPGEFFQATQEEHGSKYVVFRTAGGTIECLNQSDHNGFSGTVVSNETGIDRVSLTEGGFEFGESCPEVTGGSAFVEPINFPWTFEIHKTGKVALRGTPKVGFTITFSSGPTCVYAKTAIKGAAIPTPEVGTQQPLNLSIENEAFKVNQAASKGSCPKTDTA